MNEFESAGTAVDSGTETDPSLRRVRRVSHLLDESIRLPGGYRIGLDPILGILPVAGDVLASLPSAYILAEAAYAGVPKATLARMVLNVLLDTVVGSVPILGVIFDAFFKANVRNVALLESRVADPETATADRRVLFAYAVGVVVLVVGVTVAALAAVVWLLGRLGVF